MESRFASMEMGGFNKEVGNLRSSKIIDVDIGCDGVDCNDWLITVYPETCLFIATKFRIQFSQ